MRRLSASPPTGVARQKNPVVRDYWEASKEQRATLEHTSDEAQIGRTVDGLIRDLDEADTDEWWVAGTPPSS
ncbi:DUF6082 family protein [Streptomyces seoulensis]